MGISDDADLGGVTLGVTSGWLVNMLVFWACDGVTIPVLLGVDRPTTGGELYDLVQRARG